ncbi:MAG TPA: hypothetical protein VGO40_08275 [Longimicrobium sp.]|nr:hypothetical protein [Longimicrobium sp.]
MTKEINGYEVSAGFYPGFARAISVDGVSLYDQKVDGPFPFNLPDGKEAWASSAMSLSSTKGYRVVLSLDDPNHAIDHLELVLRPPPKEDGGVIAHQAGGGDRWTIDNTVVLCPPMCNP